MEFNKFEFETPSRERITSSEKTLQDTYENKLRPRTMAEYFGQEKVKANLSVYIQAAKSRKESLDHVLLYGPPGLGKTTLSHIIAGEMGAQIRVTSGPAIERAGDLASILSNLNDGDILFIDEIHRLNRNIEEILYPAMEDFALDFVFGKGPTARSVRLPLKQFTLIGATTKAGMLSGPLRDRFGVMCRMEMYTPEELLGIVNRSASILDISIDRPAAMQIAKRSRGTPRIANRLLRRVRDYAQVAGFGTVNEDICNDALKRMEVDELGLDATDVNILSAIIDKFAGGPVGLDTLAAASGEEANTIEDVYEPYLLQLGFISRTPRGRICMPAAYKHLGRKVPSDPGGQISMFEKEDGADA